MDKFGLKLLNILETVTELIALGFGLKKETFTRKLEKGPHILSPTASNLERN